MLYNHGEEDALTREDLEKRIEVSRANCSLLLDQALKTNSRKEIKKFSDILSRSLEEYGWLMEGISFFCSEDKP